MDNITQGVIWWSLYTLITGKHSKRHMRLGALITNIPDFDIFVSRIVTSDPISQMFFHRWLMHSLAWNLWVACVIAYVLYKSDSSISYRRYMLACAVATLGGHLLIDWLTSYGMRYRLPRSDIVQSRDSIFIIDLGMWGITIFGLIMYHMRSRFQKVIATLIVWIVGIYISFAICIRSTIGTQMQTDFQHTYPDVQVLEYRTFAEPLQIFLWRQLVRTSTGYYEWYKSVWDTQDLTQWQWIAQDMTWSRLIDSLIAGDDLLTRDLNHVMHFTRWRHQIVATDRGYRIYNLVFSRINGWESDQPRMFAFDLVASKPWSSISDPYHVVMDRSSRRWSLSRQMWYKFRNRVRGRISSENHEG